MVLSTGWSGEEIELDGVDKKWCWIQCWRRDSTEWSGEEIVLGGVDKK